MLKPPPVVVDADVLIRNVDYAVRNGYAGALTGHASRNYSLTTGVVLFAAAEAGGEAIRHLVDIAERRSTKLAEVQAIWNSYIVPTVRFVDVREEDVDDPRIAGVHAKDVPTGRLAALLAPAVLATDNRKHFESFGLPMTKTDAVALDLFAVGQFTMGVRGAAVFPTLAGALTVDGSKKVISKLGSDTALLIGAILLGGLVLFVTSERGRALRSKIGDVGPPLAQLIESASAAGERVHAFAIERLGEPDPTALLAGLLATDQPVMTTREIADWLHIHRLGFEGGRAHRTETRGWLARTPCFHEVARGHWALGYHSAEL